MANIVLVLNVNNRLSILPAVAAQEESTLDCVVKNMPWFKAPVIVWRGVVMRNYFCGMGDSFKVERTTTADPAFQHLVACLDHELWVELEEDQATYDKHNKVQDIKTAVVVYAGKEPVACGCFKKYNEDTVEIKRMFVQKRWRGKGLSKKVLTELESWAVEKGNRFSVLETSVRFDTAKQLYKSTGYQVISNYPPYVGLVESVCMRKALQS